MSRYHKPKPLEQVASIGAWTEVIDDRAVAGIAVLRLTDRGAVYGAGTMMLLQVQAGTVWVARRDARDGAMSKLLAEIKDGAHYRPGHVHHHRYYGLPLIERLRDLNRA